MLPYGKTLRCSWPLADAVAQIITTCLNAPIHPWGFPVEPYMAQFVNRDILYHFHLILNRLKPPCLSVASTRLS